MATLHQLSVKHIIILKCKLSILIKYIKVYNYITVTMKFRKIIIKTCLFISLKEILKSFFKKYMVPQSHRLTNWERLQDRSDHLGGCRWLYMNRRSTVL